MPVQWSDHIQRQNRKSRIICTRCGWDLPESSSRFDAALALAKSDGEVKDLWADRHFVTGKFDLELAESDGGGVSPKVSDGGGSSPRVSKRKTWKTLEATEGSETLEATGEKDLLHRATLLPAFPNKRTPSVGRDRERVKRIS